MNSDANPEQDAQCVIWRFCDGKRRHENQSAGLIEALADRYPVIVHRVALPKSLPPPSKRQSVHDNPTLIIGAGHATHLPMLRARRTHGGRIVVLMRPTLPRRCFDLCIVPEHDGLRARADTLISRGVLNRVRPGARRAPNEGLMLLGGPSRHHDWNDTQILDQIAIIAASRAHIRWQLASSRRTPATLLSALNDRELGNVDVVPVAAVDPNWLPARLAVAAEVWVSADSVSMVYEALSGGAGVGVIEVAAHPRRLRTTPDRVLAGLNTLIEQKLVTCFGTWDRIQPLAAAAQPLAEAQRCAAWISEHWLGKSP